MARTSRPVQVVTWLGSIGCIPSRTAPDTSRSIPGHTPPSDRSGSRRSTCTCICRPSIRPCLPVVSSGFVQGHSSRSQSSRTTGGGSAPPHSTVRSQDHSAHMSWTPQPTLSTHPPRGRSRTNRGRPAGTSGRPPGGCVGDTWRTRASTADPVMSRPPHIPHVECRHQDDPCPRTHAPIDEVAIERHWTDATDEETKVRHQGIPPIETVHVQKGIQDPSQRRRAREASPQRCLA